MTTLMNTKPVETMIRNLVLFLLLLSPAHAWAARVSFMLNNSPQPFFIASNKDVSLWATCANVGSDYALTVYAETTASAAVRVGDGAAIIDPAMYSEANTLYRVNGSGTPGWEALGSIRTASVMSLDTGNALITDGAMFAVNPPGALTGDCYASFELRKVTKFKSLKPSPP